MPHAHDMVPSELSTVPVNLTIYKKEYCVKQIVQNILNM